MLTSTQLGTLNLREGWGGKFWLPKALDEAVVAKAHENDDELCKFWLHITFCDLLKALDEAVVANAHGNDKLCKAMLKVTIDNPKE